MRRVLLFSFMSNIQIHIFMGTHTLVKNTVYIVTTLCNSSYAKHLLVQYIHDYAMEYNQLLC